MSRNAVKTFESSIEHNENLDLFFDFQSFISASESFNYS